MFRQTDPHNLSYPHEINDHALQNPQETLFKLL